MGLNRLARPVPGSVFSLQLGPDERRRFEEQRAEYWETRLDEISLRYLVETTVVTLDRAASLADLASRYSVETWQLAAFNVEQSENIELAAGTVLIALLLKERPVRSPSEIELASPGGTTETEGGLEVLLKSGENIARYARWAGIEVDDIMARNPEIENPNRMHVGDRVYLPLNPEQIQRFLQKRKRFHESR